MKKHVLVLDVDGVLTDGKFHYTKDGKVSKTFGADDHDAIRLMKQYLEVVVVSADKIGFGITKKRIQEDMGLDLHEVSSADRPLWILNNFPNHFRIYIGDGFYDHKVFEVVDLGITVNNALDHVKEAADFVSSRSGGDRAVAEACLYILKKVFGESL